MFDNGGYNLKNWSSMGLAVSAILLFVCQITVVKAKLECSKEDIHVDLTSRGLTQIPNNLNRCTTNMTLSNNSISSLGNLNLYPYLKYLKLDGNLIKTEELKKLSLAKHLQVLDLSRNCLEELDLRNFRQNIELTILILNDNPGMEITANSVTLPYFTTLSLQGNNLESIPLAALRGFPNLESLDLRNNRLSQLSPDICKTLLNLHVITDEFPNGFCSQSGVKSVKNNSSLHIWLPVGVYMLGCLVAILYCTWAFYCKRNGSTANKQQFSEEGQSWL